MKSFIFHKMASNAVIHIFWSLIMAISLACSTGLVAQDQPVADAKPRAPWLGFEVNRADAAVRAQLPKLPKGVGFVISQIDPQGPAHQAGLRAFDILWKWNDQWLVNEAQLATLLDLQKAGDRVKLAVYRAGKEHVFEVVLGHSRIALAAAMPSSLPRQRVLTAAVPDRSKDLDINSRTARLEDANAVLEMEKREDGLWLSIVDTQGVTIFDGPYSSSAKSSIPLTWHDRLDALQRTLQKSQAPVRSIAPPRADVSPDLPRVAPDRAP